MPCFDHGPKFKTISAEEKSFLLKLHQNLGHPHGQKLCSMLRQQGYSPRLCQAAMDLSCSVCQNTKEPKHQRPSTIKRELDFNDCIGIDGVVYTNLAGTNFHFYHIIDYGTNYQVACASPGKSSDDAKDKVLNGWLQWAGAPIEIHTDLRDGIHIQGICHFSRPVQHQSNSYPTRCTLANRKSRKTWWNPTGHAQEV